MTTDQPVTYGAETDTLRGSAGVAGDTPQAAPLDLGAPATDEGACTHSLAKLDSDSLGGDTIARDTREYPVPDSGWPEVLDAEGWMGSTGRVEPIAVTLSALASCSNVGISISAVANGGDIEPLRTDQVGAWARRAPVYSLISLANVIDHSVNAAAEVPADD